MTMTMTTTTDKERALDQLRSLMKPPPKPDYSAWDGMRDLAEWMVSNRSHATTAYLHACLISLYNSSKKVDLSGVHFLDRPQRKALCAVIFGIGGSDGTEFYDHHIRVEFSRRGEQALTWFTGILRPKPDAADIARWLAEDVDFLKRKERKAQAESS